jgi:hypothetical protein
LDPEIQFCPGGHAGEAMGTAVGSFWRVGDVLIPVDNKFTPSRIVNARGNITLPLESPPEVGDINRQRCTTGNKINAKMIA